MDKESTGKSVKSKKEKNHPDSPHKEIKEKGLKSTAGLKSPKQKKATGGGGEGKHVLLERSSDQSSSHNRRNSQRKHSLVHGDRHKGSIADRKKSSGVTNATGQFSGLITLLPASAASPKNSLKDDPDREAYVSEILQEFLDIAGDICHQRFYRENAPTLLNLQLRDTWLRIVEMEWMDVDMKKRESNNADNEELTLPNAIFMPDLPPRPLSYDSWVRGGLEEFPREKRESILDPFLRDYSQIPHPKGSSLLRFQKGSEMSWIDGHRLLGIGKDDIQDEEEDEEEEETSVRKSDKTRLKNKATKVKGKLPSSNKSKSKMAKGQKGKTFSKKELKSKESKSKKTNAVKSATSAGVSKKAKAKKTKIPVFSQPSTDFLAETAVADENLEKLDALQEEMEEEGLEQEVLGEDESEIITEDTTTKTPMSPQEVIEEGGDDEGQEIIIRPEEGFVDMEEDEEMEELFPPITDLPNNSPVISSSPDDQPEFPYDIPKKVKKRFQTIVEPRRLESKSSEDIGSIYYKSLGLKPWTPDDCGVWTGMGYGIFRLQRQTTMEALRLARLKSISVDPLSGEGNNNTSAVTVGKLDLTHSEDNNTANKIDEPMTDSIRSSKLEYYSESRSEFLRQNKSHLPKTSISVVQTPQKLTQSEKDFFDHKMQVYRQKLLRQQNRHYNDEDDYDIVPTSSNIREKNPIQDNPNIGRKREEEESPVSKGFSPLSTTTTESIPPQSRPSQPIRLMNHMSSSGMRKASPVKIPEVVMTSPNEKEEEKEEEEPPLNQPRMSLGAVVPVVHYRGLPRNSDQSNLEIELGQFTNPEEKLMARLAAKGVILPDFQFESREFQNKAKDILLKHKLFTAENQRHITKMYEDSRAQQLRDKRKSRKSVPPRHSTTM